MRSQTRNRTYETKYDNETYRFIRSLNPDGMLKDTAEELSMTYEGLFYSFSINRIPHRLKKKIEKVFSLTPDQVSTLNELTHK